MNYKNIPIARGLILAFALLMASCYYRQELPVEPDSSNVGAMSFSKDIIPLFNQSCNTAGCHNGAVAPDLRPANAYNALISGNYLDAGNPENSELYQWMRGNRGLAMPPSGPNAAYNVKILAWIKQGSLNN